MLRKRMWFRASVCKVLISLIFFGINVVGQNLRIDEFMALNSQTITDEDGLYSDWIEIFNPTVSDISLKGWFLTDQAELPYKWTFPDTIIQSGGVILVFASGKNVSVPGKQLHANFKLSGSGEYLGFFDNDTNGVTVFDPYYPEQSNDISYGYYEGTYLQIGTPTPGSSSAEIIYPIIPAPVLGTKHGFFDAPFSLSITCDVGSAEIYYTTNGSVPSKTNGTKYTSPLTIDSTSIIRAVAIVDDEEPSMVTTQTYLFLEDVIHQPNDPTGYPAEWGPYCRITGTSIADYEMDPEMMADADYANSVKAGLLDLPTVSLVSDIDHFFGLERDSITGGIYIYTGTPVGDPIGLGWERPASLEFFDNDTISLQVDCGVRLMGGHSRLPEKTPKHSFRIVFRSEYGPSRLKYNFFGDEATDNFNGFAIRAGFGNSWVHHSHSERNIAQHTRDSWTKDMQGAIGHIYAHNRFVHLYINGIYWGMYNPCERADDDFVTAYLKGDKEDIDVIKDYSEAVEGNIDAWNQMMSMVNLDITTKEVYQKLQGNNPDGSKNYEYKSMLDIENLADYMLINFYGGNSDWDHHNWAAFINREKTGKGFQFLCWDSEHNIKGVNAYNVDENNANCPSGIFQRLMLNEDFKRLFAERVQLHCFGDGMLTPDKAKAVWVNRAEQVENAVLAEAARWGDYRRDVHQYQAAGPFELYSMETHWLPQQDYILNTYFPDRTNILIQQLRDAGMFPNVDAPVLKINNTPITNGIIERYDDLSMTSTSGSIYYTTDGTDPAKWSTDNTSIELVSENSDKMVYVPKSDIGENWKSDVGYDDSNWSVCFGAPGGIGYEKSSGYESYLSFDVADNMYQDGTDPNTSCFVRIKFSLTQEQLNKISSLILYMRYDDGYAAWINGQQVASANVPSPLYWNSNNTSNHEADNVESVNISEFINVLKVGDNILAVQGVNNSITSSDFIILPSMVASDDPADGSISASAQFYSAPVEIDSSTHIKARTFFNGEWSALVQQYLKIPEDYNDLKITEIHYNPLKMDTIDGDKFEFIEIKNTGNSTIDLGELYFDKGIDYKFEPNTPLKPYEFYVIAGSSKNFYKRYGFLPDDEFGGRLDNDGEKITLLGISEQPVCSFTYNDNIFWPQSPDGKGTSLVPYELNPTNAQDSCIYWRSSYYIGGSPGADDVLIDTVPIDTNDTTLSVDMIALDDMYKLEQNYPNPFSDITYIHYKIAEEARVELNVYNIMGQKIYAITNEIKKIGSYTDYWKGVDFNYQPVPKGIYFYRLEIIGNVNSYVKTNKMIKN